MEGSEPQVSLESVFAELEKHMRQMRDFAMRNFAGGEIERIRFNGKTGVTSFTDDRGSNSLAYAVYNPNNFRVFVGLGGAGATADALIVPKQKLVVAPLQVDGHIELAADAVELAEGAGNILRVRFPTPQPFFVGALN
jgi:hypothetical protein